MTTLSPSDPVIPCLVPKASFDSMATHSTQIPSHAKAETISSEDATKEEPHTALDWESDPDNARNWSSKRKWIAVSIVSFYTLIPPMASSMMAPGLPQIAELYGIKSDTITALTLSVFLASFAVGPLFVAPLSEMYGRTWILHIGNLFTLVFNLGCAFAPNTECLIAMRLMTGFSGCAPFACGGGSIGDLFCDRDRGSAMSIYTVGPLLGPALGPVIGGYIAQTIGVRYVFVVVAGACALAALFGIPFLQETYAPVIRARKAQKQTDPELAVMYAGTNPLQGKSRLEYIWINMTRPLHLICSSFICFILSLYSAFMYGIYYLMFATFADFFHDTYGFTPGLGGLAYMGIGTGFVLATLVCARWSDAIYNNLSEKNGGKGKPEMRVPILFLGSLIVPIGLFWYGWSAQAKLHYIMPIIGSAIYGFGMMLTFLPISLYLVDAFTYGASALAAAFCLRFLMGFAFPLFAKDLLTLGMGLSNSILGGLTIVLGIPFPIWIYYYGEKIRARSDLSR